MNKKCFIKVTYEMDNDYKYSHIDIMNQNKHLVMSKSFNTFLNKLAKKGCLKMVFSRFPYYNSKLQCKKLAMFKHEGNCVAFAYYMKILLKQNKLNSFLVGAKIPPKFTREGYKDICHTGVVMPYSSGVVLFDTAFYFDKAIVLDKANNYQNCFYFTNVYTKNTDKWCFTLNDQFINVKINDEDVNSYYELKEILNPYKSITVHTNNADKTVFRCEVDNKMISKFYYKINLWNNTLSVYSNTQNHINTNIDIFFDKTTNKLDTKKLKNWIFNLNLKKSQKIQMNKDLQHFLLKYL